MNLWTGNKELKQLRKLQSRQWSSNSLTIKTFVQTVPSRFQQEWRTVGTRDESQGRGHSQVPALLFLGWLQPACLHASPWLEAVFLPRANTSHLDAMSVASRQTCEWPLQISHLPSMEDTWTGSPACLLGTPAGSFVTKPGRWVPQAWLSPSP